MTLVSSQKGSASQWKGCCGIFRFILYHRCYHIGGWFVCLKKDSWLAWMPGAVWWADMLQHKWFLCFIFNIPCATHHLFFPVFYVARVFLLRLCSSLVLLHTHYPLFLNPFWLLWVYFNKLGLSQCWEEEEVYFRQPSCWEREKVTCFRVKRTALATGLLLNFLANTLRLSVLLPACSFDSPLSL